MEFLFLCEFMVVYSWYGKEFRFIVWVWLYIFSILYCFYVWYLVYSIGLVVIFFIYFVNFCIVVKFLFWMIECGGMKFFILGVLKYIGMVFVFSV